MSYRPLLHLKKQQLKQYAQDQGLVWNEDSTNQDTKYLRNHVRHNILSKFSTKDQQKLSDLVAKVATVNDELDIQLMHYLHLQPERTKLDRKTFIALPHSVAKEVMASWLRSHNIRDFDQQSLERLVVRAKTLAPGKVTDVSRGTSLSISKDFLSLQ